MQMLDWVEMNTDKVLGGNEGAPDGHFWCPDCEGNYYPIQVPRSEDRVSREVTPLIVPTTTTDELIGAVVDIMVDGNTPRMGRWKLAVAAADYVVMVALDSPHSRGGGAMKDWETHSTHSNAREAAQALIRARNGDW